LKAYVNRDVDQRDAAEVTAAPEDRRRSPGGEQLTNPMIASNYQGSAFTA